MGVSVGVLVERMRAGDLAATREVRRRLSETLAPAPSRLYRPPDDTNRPPRAASQEGSDGDGGDERPAPVLGPNGEALSSPPSNSLARRHLLLTRSPHEHRAEAHRRVG